MTSNNKSKLFYSGVSCNELIFNKKSSKHETDGYEQATDELVNINFF